MEVEKECLRKLIATKQVYSLLIAKEIQREWKLDYSSNFAFFKASLSEKNREKYHCSYRLYLKRKTLIIIMIMIIVIIIIKEKKQSNIN